MDMQNFEEQKSFTLFSLFMFRLDSVQPSTNTSSIWTGKNFIQVRQGSIDSNNQQPPSNTHGENVNFLTFSIHTTIGRLR